MNLEPRSQHSDAEKRAFYGSAAKRFKAELRLYGATAAIHLENKNDEVFWSKILKEAFPNGKFRFISASRSIGGNVTCGCTQCLQYRDFLDKNFWIAIDSDYRYLSEEPNIDARHFILQTYTYSFENHFCYWKNVQRACGIPQFASDAIVNESSKQPSDEIANPKETISQPSSLEQQVSTPPLSSRDYAIQYAREMAEAAEARKAEAKSLAAIRWQTVKAKERQEKEAEKEPTVESFDWQWFFTSYSRAVYPLLVWQLYLQSIDQEAFPKSVFHRLLTLPIGAKSLEKNGASVIHILKDRCRKFTTHLKHTYPEADETWFEARCNALGVHRDNCYLFVRGHQLYDLVIFQGKKMNRNFERELLSSLNFGEYDEIQKIHEDVQILRKIIEDRKQK